MPLQILPQEGSLGQSIGTGLTDLIQRNLGALAAHKSQQMHKAKEFEGLAPIVGPEFARMIVNASPEERKLIYANADKFRQPQYGQEPQGGMGALQGMQGQQPQEPAGLRETLAAQRGQQSPLGGLPGQHAALPEMAQPEQRMPSQAEKQAENRKLLKELYTSPQQRYQDEQLRIANKKLLNAQNKETREFLKPFFDTAEAARKNKRDYQVILDAAKSGQLRSGPGWATVHSNLERLGLGNFGKNYTTELFDKTIARLSQNIKADFGDARVTNFLESIYQRSLPSLWNTPEAVIAIAEIGMLGAEMAELREKAAYEIAQQGNGEIGYDVYQQIANKITARMEELEKQVFDIGNNLNAMAEAKSKTGYRTNKQSYGERAQANPLAYPEAFTEGSVYQDKILKNGRWVKNE